MPNWCNNTFTIEGKKEKIQEFQKFLDDNDGKEWFSFFRPCPQELLDVGNVKVSAPPNEELVEKYGHSDWYSWSLENWGCKWNCDAQDWDMTEDGDRASVGFWFDSPWGPPTTLYEFIANEMEDFDIVANYHEEGMGFVGRFEDGFDESYEYSDLESLESIPEEIVEHWDLSGLLEDREEWDEDEEDDGNLDLTDEQNEKFDQMREEYDKTMSDPWPGKVKE